MGTEARQRLERRLDLQRQEMELIGCELHDGLLQYLTAAHLQFEALRRKLETQGQPLPPELLAAGDCLQQAMREGRRLLGSLQGLDLSQTRLSADIAKLVHQAETRSAIRFELENDLPDELPTDVQLCLFRIVQEAVNNVVRHSAATAAQVRLLADDAQVHLTVSDNGHGFDRQQVPAGHFGLIGIEKRVAIAGGTCRIKSVVGAGTSVECSLPRE